MRPTARRRKTRPSAWRSKDLFIIFASSGAKMEMDERERFKAPGGRQHAGGPSRRICLEERPCLPDTFIQAWPSMGHALLSGQKFRKNRFPNIRLPDRRGLHAHTFQAEIWLEPGYLRFDFRDSLEPSALWRIPLAWTQRVLHLVAGLSRFVCYRTVQR